MSPSEQEGRQLGEGSVAVTQVVTHVAPFLLLVVSGRSGFSSLSFPLYLLGSFASCPHDRLDFPKHKRGLREGK